MNRFSTLHFVDRRRGFTLIELLVVISIIALLIAILLPALAKARETAQNVACLSNQRQLGISMAMYQGDFHGFFPPYSYDDPFPVPYYADPAVTWAGMLWGGRYFNSGLILDCPTLDDGRNFNFTELSTNYPVHGTQFKYSSYGYAYEHVGSTFRLYPDPDVGESDWRTPARPTDLAKPGRTIVLGDSLDGAVLNSGSYLLVSHNFSPRFRANPLHDNSVNIGWADGHASPVKVDDPARPYFTGLTRFQDAENFWDRE